MRRQAFWVVIFVCVGALVLGVIWTLTSIRSTQLEGTPTGMALLHSAQRIEDCTTPGGECYERGQTQTADAVGDINRVIVLASACSVGLNPEWSVARRQSAIQSCVITRLSRNP